ncbi:rhodanese-like domain-containing protein [Acidocella sp. KAb 2-4]|uniref:rhodanese-like domain-containing protein n=1 Tax=Acidocella sp. KAb 2-4 TaxID=2885158 RepID=UPI001D08F9D2|nr:rhodanese-like domain-containing protein [Acidocella sp. KAb 2-4]MCB5944035.1 rhodanese-like domain-containing protein [Acidocella sp. KAb 2-4]
MLFFTGKKTDLRDFTPRELEAALAKGEVILVDVREHGEHADVRIEGAICHPLSSFNPKALPAGNVVLHCGVGRRSAMAAEHCAKAGVKIAGHLAGGLNAWVQAGLPVKTN